MCFKHIGRFLVVFYFCSFAKERIKMIQYFTRQKIREEKTNSMGKALSKIQDTNWICCDTEYFQYIPENIAWCLLQFVSAQQHSCTLQAMLRQSCNEGSGELSSTGTTQTSSTESYRSNDVIRRNPA